MRRHGADGLPTDPSSEWSRLSNVLSDWAVLHGVDTAHAARLVPPVIAVCT
jgi:hypothetical protein